MKVKELRLSRRHNLQKIKLAYESLEIGITMEVDPEQLDTEVEEAYRKLEMIFRKFASMYAAGEIQ